MPCVQIMKVKGIHRVHQQPKTIGLKNVGLLAFGGACETQPTQI